VLRFFVRSTRKSSLEEYAEHYLSRQAEKGDSRPILDQPDQQVRVMRECHQGKMRNWFDGNSEWHIVELDAKDLGCLVFLECDWTKQAGLVVLNGPNYRVLRRVAENALANGYLDSPQPDRQKHKDYYASLANGSLRLTGPNRVAVCSAEPSEIESNPDASYYLLDGVGRCLPYMMLLLERKVAPVPVEAFLAKRRPIAD
jgi:hypothetical protein